MFKTDFYGKDDAMSPFKTAQHMFNKAAMTLALPLILTAASLTTAFSQTASNDNALWAANTPKTVLVENNGGHDSRLDRAVAEAREFSKTPKALGIIVIYPKGKEEKGKELGKELKYQLDALSVNAKIIYVESEAEYKNPIFESYVSSKFRGLYSWDDYPLRLAGLIRAYDLRQVETSSLSASPKSFE